MPIVAASSCISSATMSLAVFGFVGVGTIIGAWSVPSGLEAWSRLWTRAMAVAFGALALVAVGISRGCAVMAKPACGGLLTVEDVEAIVDREPENVQTQVGAQRCDAVFLDGRVRIASIELRGVPADYPDWPKNRMARSAKAFGGEVEVNKPPGPDLHVYRNASGFVRVAVSTERGETIIAQFDDQEVDIDAVEAWLPTLVERLPLAEPLLSAP